jgi:hypothetical protein
MSLHLNPLGKPKTFNAPLGSSPTIVLEEVNESLEKIELEEEFLRRQNEKASND